MGNGRVSKPAREGAFWSGSPGGTDPLELQSAWQYPPVFRQVQAPGAGYAAAATIPADPNSPANITFAPYCSWCFVADDGGAGALLIYPGRGGNQAVTANKGQLVWIGDGSLSITYMGTAPTSAVKLIGCTPADAIVYAAAFNQDSVAPGSLPQTVYQGPIVVNNVTKSVGPFGLPGIRSILTVDPNANAPIFMGTKAQVDIQTGQLVTQGGNFEFNGLVWVNVDTAVAADSLFYVAVGIP